MPRSKTYGANGWQGQVFRDNVFADHLGGDKFSQRKPVQSNDPAPPPAIDPLAPTFYAGLANDIDAKVGETLLPGVFSRSSAATFENQLQELDSAPGNTPRFSYSGGNLQGHLDEPPVTNKCQVYNANPDAALSGWLKQGDPAAILTRALDVSNLAAAKLQKVCTSGYVYRLDNTSGAANAWVRPNGPTGNTNEHTCTVYWRGTGTGALGSSSTVGTFSALPAQYTKKENTVPGTATDEVLQITVAPGAIVYFVIAQFEEFPFATTSIVTIGAAATRDRDKTSWPMTGYQNQSAGMSAILWTPRWDHTRLANGSSEYILLLDILQTTSALFYVAKSGVGQSEFRSVHSGAAGPLAVLNWTAGTLYLIVVRWTQSGNEHQIAVKTGGTWTDGSVVTYPGTFVVGSDMALLPVAAFPSNARALYLWDEDKGLAWLKSYFAGVAN